MKSYPSIGKSTPGCWREFTAHVFDKLDGSNLRFEWSRKTGWYKYGTRKRLLDESDKVFGSAIGLFHRTLAKDIEEVLVRQGKNACPSAVVFAEFWGPHSIAGFHKPDDDMRLTLIDVAPYKRGILGPAEFLDLFGHLDIPHYFGKLEWSGEFVRKVRAGELESVTFEGVVGKAIVRKKLVMEKAKTQAWIDRVLEIHGHDKGSRLVNS